MITAFWAERTPRERLLLLLMCASIATYALIAGVWLPLLATRNGLMQDIARHDRAASQLSVFASTGLALAPITADMPLPTLITTTAERFKLEVSRLLPAADTVEITLENASFDLVIAWIHALEQEHALRILTLTITRRPEPGLVATTLSVGR